MVRRIAAISLLALLCAGCPFGDKRMARIAKLQAKLLEDRPKLQHDAETGDPTRTDLVAIWEDQSIMQFEPTSNPDRPYVAQVRIKWMFKHTDGRPIGEAVFDYVYALDPQERWVNAADPEPAGSPRKTPPLDSTPEPNTTPKPA